MVVMRSRKNVFWEALVVTVLIFLVGLFLGMLVETSASERISELYLASEISLVDSLSTSLLLQDELLSCEQFISHNVLFADRVYLEAQELEEFEDSRTLTSSGEVLHKKFDLLRSLLWSANDGFVDRCDDYNLVVYLYEYNSEDLGVMAVQNVWSRLLSDVKLSHPTMLLLPIAADQNLTSVEYQLDRFGVDRLPAVIVNNDLVVYDLPTIEVFESEYLR